MDISPTEVVKFNWLKAVYYRFMMAIDAQRKILKNPTASEKLESLEFADNFWVGPWRNQTNTKQIGRAHIQSRLPESTEEKTTVFMRFYV